jgi:hypothetical protein
MTANVNYHSVLNRFSVTDLEVIYPALKTVQDTLKAYLAGLRKYSYGEAIVQLSFFVEDELKKPYSALQGALRYFYEVSTGPATVTNPALWPLSAKVLPAVVRLNDLYYAIQKKQGVEDVVARLYLNGTFLNILEYVEHQWSIQEYNMNNRGNRNNRNNRNKSNRNKRTNTHKNKNNRNKTRRTNNSNNDPYGFGSMEV